MSDTRARGLEPDLRTMACYPSNVHRWRLAARVDWQDPASVQEWADMLNADVEAVHERGAAVVVEESNRLLVRRTNDRP